MDRLRGLFLWYISLQNCHVIIVIYSHILRRTFPSCLDPPATQHHWTPWGSFQQRVASLGVSILKIVYVRVFTNMVTTNWIMEAVFDAADDTLKVKKESGPPRVRREICESSGYRLKLPTSKIRCFDIWSKWSNSFEWVESNPFPVPFNIKCPSRNHVLVLDLFILGFHTGILNIWLGASDYCRCRVHLCSQRIARASACPSHSLPGKHVEEAWAKLTQGKRKKKKKKTLALCEWDLPVIDTSFGDFTHKDGDILQFQSTKMESLERSHSYWSQPPYHTINSPFLSGFEWHMIG